MKFNVKVLENLINKVTEIKFVFNPLLHILLRQQVKICVYILKANKIVIQC